MKRGFLSGNVTKLFSEHFSRFGVCGLSGSTVQHVSRWSFRRFRPLTLCRLVTLSTAFPFVKQSEFINTSASGFRSAGEGFRRGGNSQIGVVPFVGSLWQKPHIRCVFALPDRSRLKENFVRRTTDTNRILSWLCRAGLGLLAVAVLTAVSARLSYGQAANTGLPKGFRPPPPVPKEFSIEKPLITDEEVTAWKRTRQEFMTALGGSLSGDAPKIVDEGFRVVVQELSIVDRRDDLTDLRNAIIRYIDQNIPEKNEEMKKFAGKTVVKYARTLLDGNFHVRLQAALLIGELNLVQEVPGIKPRPAVAYVDGVPVLLDIIHPPKDGIDQPEPVRILAAMGIRRLLELGRHTLKTNSKIPTQAATRILAELEGDGTDWYHLRLCEALVQTALSTVPNSQNQQEPLIVEALARIFTSPKRSHRIRARAARLLGRAPMPGGVQAAPIAYSLVKLTQQIATEVNQRRLPAASAVFLMNDIYLAFQPETKGESTTDGRKIAGLLSTLNQPAIQSAYKDIKPLVQSIFRQFQAANGKPVQGAFAPALIQKLADWTKPADMKLEPGRVEITEPLRKTAPPTPKPVPPQAQNQGNSTNSAS